MTINLTFNDVGEMKAAIVEMAKLITADKMAQEIKHLTATIEQLDARIAADEVKQRLCRSNLRDCFKRIAKLVKEIKEVNKWQYTGK